MSVLHADIVEALRDMPSNLRYELSRLKTQDSSEATGKAITRWLSSARLAAELLHIIDHTGHLTLLGIEVVRTIKGEATTEASSSSQQIIKSGLVLEATLAALTLVDPTAACHTLAIASLEESERSVLERLTVVDQDWNLTSVGREIVRDLKWQHR